LGLSGLLVVLAGGVSGCNSNDLPVAETPPPPVSVSQPLVREVTDHDDYEGRIAAVETVEVRSRVRGHLVKVNFEAGQMVKANSLLFQIDPRPYEMAVQAAEAQLAGATAALDLAKKEYTRAMSLLRANAASREEADVWTGKQAVAQADRLKAEAALKQAKLDLDFTKIVAPIDGKISRAQVTLGNLVNAGGGETLLTTITTVDPMYVYFDVDERSLLGYRKGFRKDKADERGTQPSLKELKIPVMVGLEGEDGYPHKGVLDFADNRVNPSTGTIQVRGVLPNARGLLDAGMRARVRIPVGDPHKVVMITERAVGTDQGRKFVYVVIEQKVAERRDDVRPVFVAERRDVELGRVSDGLQIVLKGLKPEDRVIVNGIQRVRDGAKVEPKDVAMPGAAAEQPNQKTKS
jgi:RND family efflux transporter MFP subunit